jgi:hypothetical protein
MHSTASLFSRHNKVSDGHAKNTDCRSQRWQSHITKQNHQSPAHEKSDPGLSRIKHERTI